MPERIHPKTPLRKMRDAAGLEAEAQANAAIAKAEGAGELK